MYKRQGYRVLKQRLRAEPLDAPGVSVLRYDEELTLYEPLDAAGYAASIAQLGGQPASGRPKSKRPKRRS